MKSKDKNEERERVGSGVLHFLWAPSTGSKGSCGRFCPLGYLIWAVMVWNDQGVCCDTLDTPHDYILTKKWGIRTSDLKTLFGPRWLPNMCNIKIVTFSAGQS